MKKFMLEFSGEQQTYFLFSLNESQEALLKFLYEKRALKYNAEITEITEESFVKIGD